MNIGSERLNGLGADRNGARQKLRASDRTKRSGQVDGIGGGCLYRGRDCRLPVKQSVVVSLVRLNVGVENTGAAANDCFPRTGYIPCKSHSGLKEQIVVIVRCLDTAL